MSDEANTQTAEPAAQDQQVQSQADQDADALSLPENNGAPVNQPAPQDEFYDGGGDEEPVDDSASAGGEATPAGNKDQKVSDPPAPAGGIDESLLAQAEALGISREEAQAFGDPGRLASAVRVLDRQMAVLGRPRTPEQPAPAASQGVQPKPSTPPAGDSPAEFKLELNKEIVAPEVAQAFEALHAHYEGRIKALEERFQGAEQERARREAESNTAELERELTALGEDWHDTFGKDPLSKLLAQPGADKTPAFQNLNKALEEMDALARGYAASGRPVPPTGVLLRKALGLAFGDKTQELARRVVSRQLDGRKRLALARPDSHKAAQKSPVQEARDAVNAIIKERGLGA